MGIHIQNENIGERLDIFVFNTLKDKSISRNIVQKYLKQGCLVNGKESKRGYKLKEGDIVSIDEKYWDNLTNTLDLSDEIKPQKGNLDIRYEDNNCIVLYKPKGLVVHPGVGNTQNTLSNYLRYYLESKNEYDVLMDRAGIVHRIDKGVSGLMVVAKNKRMQEYLKSQFKKREVIKIYHAYLEESTNIQQFKEYKKYIQQMDTKLQPWSTWQRVEGYIGRDKLNRKMMDFRSYEFTGSRKAISYFLFSENEVLVKIETGRMHQIRVTLKHMGYHIKGDKVYGKGKGEEIMLESVLLSFKDMSGKQLTFTT